MKLFKIAARASFFALFCLAFSAQMPGQGNDGRTRVRSIEAETWNRASRGLDYSKDLPAPPKEPSTRTKTSPRDWSGLTQGWGTLAQVLAILLALAAIMYGIYFMLQQPKNRQISRDGVEITLDNLEDYLHETDLERFIRQALANGDYAQAVRLYYLQMIKNLSSRNDIQWSKEKTNRDYLREMRSHRFGPEFRHLTFIFERVWYGNIRLQPGEFQALEPDFKGFLRNVEEWRS